MKKRFILAFVLSALAGAALHFLHTWVPIPLTALFAPVNESVWEHLKLLFWPFLAAALVLTRTMPDRRRAWSAFLAALLAMPPALLAVYYLLLGALGVESLAVDVTLYVLAMAFGFFLSYRLYRSGRAEKHLGALLILAALYGVSLIAFSIGAPDLPVFRAP